MKKIIFPLIAVLMLTVAFFFGGNAPGTKSIENNQVKTEKKISPGEIINDIPEAEPEKETVKEVTAEAEKTIPEENEEIIIEEPETNPQPEEETSKEPTCTLVIKCDTILNNMDWLNSDKHELVPENGIIYAEREVTFHQGESVFNLLARETKQNRIHLEFVNVPIYKSAYIEGIGNIYEFDCGELSGWVYNVNGVFPNYGCSRYILNDGDKVEWLYTCDLGDDVGGYNYLDSGE